MKYLTFLLVCLLGLPLLRARSAPAPADADFAAYESLSREAAPGEASEIGAVNYFTWLDGHRKALKTAALAFCKAYPTDPRRWTAVMTSVKEPPFFIKDFGADVQTKGASAIIPDEAAAAKWRRQSEVLTQEMLAANDAPPALLEDAEWGLFAKDFRATSAAKAKGEPYDYRGFRARFDDHVAKYANLDVVAERAADFLDALERNQAGASEPIWRHLLEAPNAALRQAAAKRFAVKDRMTKPIDMAFTAVDGRKVDLRDYRGKVVLVDFWATWCGPCKAEIPNVKKVYTDYHDKGFEVIGISLEFASLRPTDTPAQAAAKNEKARKILTDFIAKSGMPWPQYYDGKFWDNDIAALYGIQGIPAMFLLDQNGMLVTTEARGPKLEAEVKRLLKL